MNIELTIEFRSKTVAILLAPAPAPAHLAKMTECIKRQDRRSRRTVALVMTIRARGVL